MPRDYKAEYKKFHKSKASKKARARRNKCRRKAVSSGKAKKGDSKEGHHTKAHAKGKCVQTFRKRNRRIGKPGRRRS